MYEYQNGQLMIGGVSATSLVERYGSPLYVYDESTIERQIDRFLAAFSEMPFQPFYAAKANSNLDLLRRIRSRGFGCDAVSPGEVFLAEQAGFPGDRIWFTSTNVSADDFRCLTDSSIVLNIDSMSALDQIVELGLTNPLALRVNPDIGAGHHRDVVTGGYGVKFGFDQAELGEARTTAESHGLSIAGLHAHIGSGVPEARPFLDAAEVVLDLLEDDFPEVRWVNFGGGFAIPYRIGEPEFPIEEHGRALAALVSERLERRGITAILEPGRYIVGPAGVLLATVTAKRISAGHEWIGCDTGFHHLARPSKYGSYHHVLNATRGSVEWLQADPPEGVGWDGVIVAGNLCESGDVLTRNEQGPEPRLLPPTRVGDLLAFRDAGAYGFSMASHYNARLLPAEVVIEDHEPRLIRERQTLRDLLTGQTQSPSGHSSSPRNLSSSRQAS